MRALPQVSTPRPRARLCALRVTRAPLMPPQQLSGRQPYLLSDARPGVSGVQGRAGGCPICPRGFFSFEIGSTDCSACIVGAFAAATGSTDCAGCPEGWYQDSKKGILCEACGAGPGDTKLRRASRNANCAPPGIGRRHHRCCRRESGLSGLRSRKIRTPRTAGARMRSMSSRHGVCKKAMGGGSCQQHERSALLPRGAPLQTAKLASSILTTLAACETVFPGTA